MTRAERADVQHDPEAGRFYVEVDGSTAYLDYVRLDEHTLDFRQTFVPPVLRGRGLGGDIVRFALNHARKTRLRVVPTCTFVAGTIRRDTSFSDIVVD